VNKYIDHTTLKQTTSEADIKQLCAEASQHSFAAVCVPPYWIASAKDHLKGSDVKVATVIGFPFGYSCISAKVAEVHQAYADHADEVDVVANISAIKRGDFEYLEREIQEIMKAVRSYKGLVCKVIIESGVLADEEIIRCCQIYGAAGIDYLKTSTGFAEKGVGASVHAVELFRKHLPPNVQIKASGGIRTVSDTRSMIAAGATRIGCSAGVAIMKQEKEGVSAPVDNSKAGAY
jgi:deoxyribose-phosphate aldolase